MKLRVCSILAFALAAGTSGGPASAAAKRCSLPDGATRLRSTPGMVLYRRPTGIDLSYDLIGCLKSTGRRRTLDTLLGPMFQGTVRKPTAIRTAGRFVALTVLLTGSGGAFDTSLQVDDLRSGRKTYVPLSQNGPGAASSLKLSANGRVVVVTSITSRPDPLAELPQPGLWSIQGGKPVVLEPGTGPFSAITLTAAGVRWISPSGAHSATLRPSSSGVGAGGRRDLR